MSKYRRLLWFVLPLVPLAACADYGSDGGGGDARGSDAGSDGGGDARGSDAGSDGGGGADAASTSDGGATTDATSDQTVPDASPLVCAAAPYSLALGPRRGGDSPINPRTSYDYAATVMKDGDVYKMWWCGGIAGDHVLYAESTSLAGPFKAPGGTPDYLDVFQPTGNDADFDGTHTCDPSVVRVGATYYMFYGGLAKNAATDATNFTQIGLASSTNGISWTRENGGKPILKPAASLVGKPNTYGAGQPSVTYVGGKFVLAYTDTSANASNPANGAGIYVLRSSDPTFKTGTEELTASGFAPYVAGAHGAYRLLEAFSVDWVFAPGLDLFVLAQASTPASGPLQFAFHVWRSNLVDKVGVVSGDATWKEGGAIVGLPDRSMPIAPGACSPLLLDVVYPVGTGGPDTWDLARSGWDLTVSGH